MCLAEKGLGMIKKIVLIAAMGALGLLWGSGDVTVQVINAVKEKSITHDFEKKLEKTGLDIHKVVEGGRYIVTLGTYKNEKAAQSALKKARTVVHGAFIRLVKRDQIAAAPVSTHKEATKVEAPVVAQAEVKVAVVAQAPSNLVVVEVKPVVVEVQHSPVVLSKTDSQVECDKKEVHRSEIAQAIHFYKNSPYHRFEPVKLQ